MSAEYRFAARFMMIVGFVTGVAMTSVSLGAALVFLAFLVVFTFGSAIVDVRREEKR